MASSWEATRAQEGGGWQFRKKTAISTQRITMVTAIRELRGAEAGSGRKA